MTKWVVRFAGEDDSEAWSIELAHTPEEAAVEFLRPVARDGVLRDGEVTIVEVRPVGDRDSPWLFLSVTSTWQYTVTKGAAL